MYVRAGHFGRWSPRILMRDSARAWILMFCVGVSTAASGQVVFYEGRSSTCEKYKKVNASTLRIEFKADRDKNVVIMIASMEGASPTSTVLRGCTVISDGNWRCETHIEGFGSPGRNGAKYAIDGIAYSDPIFPYGTRVLPKFECFYRELAFGFLSLTRETNNW
jgi:hypothetical protein